MLVSKKNIAAVAFLASSFGAHAAGMHITLDFTGGLTTEQESYFSSAASFWESAIVGYQAGIFGLTGITIHASGAAMDGAGGTLASGGVTSVAHRGGFTLATQGSMLFDTADINALITQNSFAAVIQHEMAHVLGFGTLWTNNGVYVDGTGHYTGANALAAYRTEFNQPAATYVPVELGGGLGTADGHWDEVNFGGANTGIAADGKDMRFELMTGWINAPVFVSQTTIASFADIGYLVSAVPEPGMALMFAIGLPLLAGLTRRQRSRREGNTGLAQGISL